MTPTHMSHSTVFTLLLHPNKEMMCRSQPLNFHLITHVNEERQTLARKLNRGTELTHCLM